MDATYDVKTCLWPTSADRINMGRIHFEVEGQGLALVIYHGFLGSPASWRAAGYVDAFTDCYRMEAFGDGEIVPYVRTFLERAGDQEDVDR